MKGKFIFWLYVTVFSAVICIILAVLLIPKQSSPDTPPENDDAPAFGDTVTYISNENGSVRLTDTLGFAFEFSLELKRDFQGLEFEIPLYGERENRLIIASTKEGSESRPKIYVNGVMQDELPREKEVYKIRLDIGHITSRGFCDGNTLTVVGFGKIDLLAMY